MGAWALRIGFDVSQTGREKAGCGTVAEMLVREFAAMAPAHEFYLYPVFGDLFWDPRWEADTALPAAEGFRRGPGFASYEEAGRFWRTPPADFEERLGRPDVIHSNNFFCPSGLTEASLVFTLHDVEFCAHPEWSTEMNRLGCFEGVARASAFADRVIAVSEYSRRRFLEIFPHYAAWRVVVVPPASRFPTGGSPRRPEVEEIEAGQYLLGVSTIEPRKNMARLIRAYRRFADTVEEAPALVLAGKRGWRNEEVDRAVAEVGGGGRVVFTGYVQDEELEWLYGNCAGFVFPSLAEGFGLPLLEAMSLGAACLCGGNTAMIEVAGDAALAVNALDEGEIAEGMRRLWGEDGLRDRLRARGRERARGYGWRSSARRVMEVYEELELERVNR